MEKISTASTDADKLFGRKRRGASHSDDIDISVVFSRYANANGPDEQHTTEKRGRRVVPPKIRKVLRKRRRPREYCGLEVGQIRVLRVLKSARGPISKEIIASELGVSTITVVYSIGLNNLDSRKWQEEHYTGFPTLLTRKMVRPVQVIDDGIRETGYELTGLGKKAYEDTKYVNLPPVKGK